MKNLIMKPKKGQLMPVVLLIAVIALGLVAYMVFTGGSSQKVIDEQKDLIQDQKSGKVASIGVYVRDLANDDVNTKVAIATYCKETDGAFIIDGTSSSTSAEITGKTTVGKEITCWAFSSTYQTMQPTTITVDEEAEHIVIDAYQFATTAEATVFDDTFTNSNNGAVNLSVGADGSDSFAKMKFKNNNTDKFIPLGGFFIDVVEDTNVSNIDMTGSVALKGFDHGSANIVTSDLNTAVSARKSQWDYVFEIDDDSGEAGNQALIIDENDYIETGPITFESNVGCTAGSTGARGVVRGFVKGYFRETKNTGVGYGHETDSSSASRIGNDITGTNIFCA